MLAGGLPISLRALLLQPSRAARRVGGGVAAWWFVGRVGVRGAGWPSAASNAQRELEAATELRQAGVAARARRELEAGRGTSGK